MAMRIMGTMLAALGCAALASTPLLAHMPYILPSAFETARDRITVAASFGEDAFHPEIAMKDAPFEITAPDGKVTRLPSPMLTGDLTILEAMLPGEGLYRLSSGQRLGRMGKMYHSAGTWTVIGEGASPPPGKTLIDVRSATIADAYVLRGKPGAPGARVPRGKALEIHPLGDPASYAPGAVAMFEILYDGKPLSGMAVTLFREAGFYDGRKEVGTATTDLTGKIALTPPDAGRYLLLVRHRTATPGGSDPYTSFTATLAFEAL